MAQVWGISHSEQRDKRVTEEVFVDGYDMAKGASHGYEVEADKRNLKP